MAGETNYVLLWLVYLASSLGFYLVFWKFSGLLGSLTAWLARIFLAALIFTPVFPRSEGEVAVPALMAIALDSIAFGPGAAARGLAALATGMVFAFLAALAVFLVLTFGRKRPE